jgi:hypothetical protein
MRPAELMAKVASRGIFDAVEDFEVDDDAGVGFVEAGEVFHFADFGAAEETGEPSLMPEAFGEGSRWRR